MKAILEKVKDWWVKFSTRQKILLLSITAVVVIALIILAVVMSRPKMIPLITCEDATEAASVKDLLDSDGNIDYEVSQDGMTFRVNSKDQSDANILLGSNNIQTKGYSIEDAIDGSFSTTESDKSRKYQLYLQEKFEDELETMPIIDAAEVNLNIPVDDGTIISRGQETYAGVKLTLNDTMDEEQAATLARYIATELGNDTTDCVTIIDQNSNMLFAGGESSSVMGTASSQLSYQSKAEAKVKQAVVDVVNGTYVYDNVAVGLNLKLNFDQVTTNETNYSAQGDRDEGLITHEDRYESNATGGTAGVPGTDSNGEDGTTYVLPDGEISESSVTDTSIDHALDQKDTTTIGSVGDIEYEESSITVALARYVTYDEDVLRANGTLDDMTFDEFCAQNSERVKGTVDADMYTMVSNATGIPEANISIVTYDIPMFKESEGSKRTWQDYLQIALAVLIFALLGYVVFRSTRKEEEAEIEPELSVESLLESTKEAEMEALEDIGYKEKSEIRVLIEKFVDENPEAVASLLRNWLNEEWN